MPRPVQAGTTNCLCDIDDVLTAAGLGLRPLSTPSTPPLDCAPQGSSAACVGVADDREEDAILSVRSQHIMPYALMHVCLTWPY